MWTINLRYLGIFILAGKSFRCCFDNARKSFYRAFNALFGKIGRAASVEVVLSLIRSKCLPRLLFCLEVCPLSKSDLRSLNFTVKRVLIKVLNTHSDVIIEECQVYFNFPSVETLIESRKLTFVRKYRMINSILFNVFAEVK